MVDFDEATRYVSDNELQRLLQVMRQEMPNLGEALVIGQLHARDGVCRFQAKGS